MSGNVVAVGGYLPLLRMDRKQAARELAWTGLGMPRAGTRAVACWDEDTLTMAVEASRTLVAPSPAALRFASTSAYFTDRAQSTVMVDALALPRSIRSSDAANSRRAGTSALLDALLAGGDEVIAASEKRPTQAGSAAQLAYGDGAAAVRTGTQAGAKLIGHISFSHDLVDRYTSRDRPVPYAYEERFVRDTAVAELYLPAVGEALRVAGVAPSDIAHVAAAEPVGATWKAAARKLGIVAPNHAEAIDAAAGDLGAAAPLYALGVALAHAKVGDRVLLVGFGSGIDVLVFTVEAPVAGAGEMRAALAEGEAITHVSRFLNLVEAVKLDWGMRSEFEQKAQASVLERVGRDVIGFVGGRDSMGQVQFPKSAYPVNPALSHPEVMEDVRLADLSATIVSVTADRLNFSPDPPFDFGLVQFDADGNGGSARVLMEMVDRPARGFAVGDRVRMRLRVKSTNARLGFRTYFWKAAPITRPSLGDA